MLKFILVFLFGLFGGVVRYYNNFYDEEGFFNETNIKRFIQLVGTGGLASIGVVYLFLNGNYFDIGATLAIAAFSGFLGTTFVRKIVETVEDKYINPE